MKLTKGKKAVEPIVGTVLLLLITVAAAAIIFGVIVPLIQNKLIEAGTSSCMNARVVVNTKEGFTCYDAANKRVNVMVSRGPEDFELSGVQIILAIDGTTQAFIMNNTATLPGKNEQITYSINVSLPSPDSRVKEVGVAPIVKMGNIQQLCGMTSSTKLEKCS